MTKTFYFGANTSQFEAFTNAINYMIEFGLYKNGMKTAINIFNKKHKNRI